MRKRRRARWIIGGVLGFVVLYSTAAYWVAWNSTDAKLERALDTIIAANGFEFIGNVPVYQGSEKLITNGYEGEPISQENKERILVQFEEACPACTVDFVTVGQGMRSHDPTDSEPFFDTYHVLTPEGTNVRWVTITFDDKGLSINDDSPSSLLGVTRPSDESLWSFLKNLWPW